MLVRPGDLWQMESSISWIWFKQFDKTLKLKLKIDSPLCYFIHPVVRVTSKIRTNKKNISAISINSLTENQRRPS